METKEYSHESHVEAAHIHDGLARDIDLGNSAILLDIGAKNVEHGGAGGLKLAKDGHTILIPQPSDHADDPLNWSRTKKNLILMTIGVSAFLADFQAGAAIPCILPQAAEWHMTPNQVNYAGNLNVLMVGVGGVFWIPFIYFWGRAPILFWMVFLGTMFSLGAALAQSFEAYYGLRALLGFTLTAGQTIGLAFIQDMFFFHQHAQKIGIWTSLFLVSPYCGPLFGNFIIGGTGSWRAVMWLVFGLGCFNLVLIVLFVDESWYRRELSQGEQPHRGNRMSRLIGIWQLRVHKGYFLSIAMACKKLTFVLVKPIILPILIYYMMSFMWAVGINQTSSILFATPIPLGGYGFGPTSLGYLFFTPLVAVFIGESFGHFFNDFVANRYIRTHGGVFKPEARLWPIYIAGGLMVPGLILVGQALFHHLHWVAIVFGWGMYVVGCLIASVAITAYALDSYPTASGEVSGLINFARIIGGFSVGYFQLDWGKEDGFDVSFGVQAGLVAVALVIIVCLHVWGGRMRAKGGPLRI